MTSTSTRPRSSASTCGCLASAPPVHPHRHARARVDIGRRFGLDGGIPARPRIAKRSRFRRCPPVPHAPSGGSRPPLPHRVRRYVRCLGSWRHQRRRHRVEGGPPWRWAERSDGRCPAGGQSVRREPGRVSRAGHPAGGTGCRSHRSRRLPRTSHAAGRTTGCRRPGTRWLLPANRRPVRAQRDRGCRPRHG